MKKIIALFLVAIMLFTVTGCRKNKDNSSDNTSGITTEIIDKNESQMADSEATSGDSSVGDSKNSSKQETASKQNGKDNSSKNESSKPKDTSSDKTNSTPTNNKEEPENATPASDFEYEIANGYVKILGYKGSDPNVVIPSYIENYPVEGIYFAFMNNQIIRSVKLPDTLVYIIDASFVNCKNLVSVDCGKGLKEIYKEAFYGCSALEEVKLSPVLEKIGEKAFADCPSLKSIKIPKTVKEWGFTIFWNDKALTEVTFEEGIEKLGSYGCFWNCNTLESATIPASVNFIDDKTFDACDSLKSAIFLGDAPETVGEKSFGEPNKEFIVYYKKGTFGWDTTTLKDDYTLKCIDE